VRAHGLVRAGAMRKLAAAVVDFHADVLAVCEIGSGDARALATRFALQWAYRGRQAIFWQAAFHPQRITDLYLPARTPLRRAGFVHVEGTMNSEQCALTTTQFARSREQRIAQLHFARTHLRMTPQSTLFFACSPERAMPLSDLGFRKLAANDEAAQNVYVRGFEALRMRVSLAEV
jgi:hypothetical protein